MAENNKINETCLHGTPRDKLCWHCRDEYINNDADEYLGLKGKIRSDKSEKNFDLAFEIYRRAKRWLSLMKTENLQEYIKKLREREPSLSRESLQLAYNVAKKFPELENLSNRKFPFDWYREIANRDLTEIQRKEICKEIEKRLEREKREVVRKENRLSSQKIRDMIREKIKVEQEPSQLPDEIKILYTTAKSCLKEIKEYLRDKKIQKHTPLIFKIDKEP